MLSGANAQYHGMSVSKNMSAMNLAETLTFLPLGPSSKTSSKSFQTVDLCFITRDLVPVVGLDVEDGVELGVAVANAVTPRIASTPVSATMMIGAI